MNSSPAGYRGPNTESVILSLLVLIILILLVLVLLKVLI